MTMLIGTSCYICSNDVAFLLNGGIGFVFVFLRYNFPSLLMAALAVSLRALGAYGKATLSRLCFLLLLWKL